APSSALAATLPVPTGEGGAGPASVRPVPPCPARPIPRGVPENIWCKVCSMRRPCPTGVFPSSFFCAGDRRGCTHLSYPQGDTIESAEEEERRCRGGRSRVLHHPGRGRSG